MVPQTPETTGVTTVATVVWHAVQHQTIEPDFAGRRSFRGRCHRVLTLPHRMLTIEDMKIRKSRHAGKSVPAGGVIFYATELRLMGR